VWCGLRIFSILLDRRVNGGGLFQRSQFGPAPAQGGVDLNLTSLLQNSGGMHIYG
jgi:hypothetical protein